MTETLKGELTKQYLTNPSPLLIKKLWKAYYADVDAFHQPTLKVAILSSFTVDNWKPYIEVQGAIDGLPTNVQVGSYGQFRQDVYDENSWLVSMDPDVVIVAIEGDAVFGPAAINDPALTQNESSDIFDRGLDEILNLISHLVKTLPKATILINNLVVPTTSTYGILENKLFKGPPSLYKRVNELLLQNTCNMSNVYVVDIDNLASLWGKRNFIDDRMKFLADMRFADRYLPHLANLYGRYFRAIRGKIRKCLVVDLDNTLWGGIIGEDGFDGIKLDPVKAPGSAYYAFQLQILGLYHRGIILAINSKNNKEDALKVLEFHPCMVLRPNHFAAMAINWNDKSENMKSLAEELNIGLDAMVFLDDDPHQCGLMEAMLPEVITRLLPEDPSYFERFLSSLEVFDTLTYSEEDSRRGEMYAQERLRRDEFKNETSSGKSLEQYYRDLQMECVIGEPDDFTIPRIAQLTQRTNQFNLTTRRYSEGEIRNFVISENASVRWISLKDRFGDLGLVGVIILLEKDVGSWEIDTFLMSCRALGRQVETAFLHRTLSVIFSNGASEVFGVYTESSKNSQVASFYGSMGFTKIAEGRYRLASIDQLPVPSEWVIIQS